MMLQRLIPVAALLMLAACGQGTSDSGGDPADAANDDSQAGAGANADEDVVYQGALTVLQGVERDAAELCGVVAESYPPQCGACR